jgi:hypothetical protein
MASTAENEANLPRSLSVGGAEGLVRIRYPHWGMVSPSYFKPRQRTALRTFVRILYQPGGGGLALLRFRIRAN